MILSTIKKGVVLAFILQCVILYTLTTQIRQNQNQPWQFMLSIPSKEVVLLPDSPDPRLVIKQYQILRQDSGDGNITTTCPFTSQVRILQKDNGQWFLESLDPRGKLKSVGGDEFYIEFRSHDKLESKHPTAVAVFDDLQDGTYALEFYRTFMKDEPVMMNETMKDGMLGIWLQYTCGIGRMAPPSKDSYTYGGYFTDIHWEKTLKYAPPIKDMPTMKLSNNRTLNEYDLVLYVGDSIMRNLHMDSWQNHFQSKSFFEGSVSNPLNSATVDHFISLMQKTIKKGKRIVGVPPNAKIAIILGSALWDVLVDMEQGTSYQNHLETITKFIEQVRIETKLQNSDHFDLYWKLPTALHVHVVPKKAGQIARYMSTSRIQQLYLFQKRLMGELEMPTMDYYLASYVSCSWLEPRDGRHYVPEFNKAISNMFFFGNNSNAVEGGNY